MTGTRPFAPFEWVIAGRYLKTRLIALLSFLGIMLGVATLIIVLSVMNGFRKELLEKLVGINGHIFVAAIDSPLTDYVDVADRLSKVYGVRRAVPFVEGQVFASSPYNGSGALVRGVRGPDMPKITAVSENIRQGTLDNFEQSGGVAIGRRLADSLGLGAGDTISLLTPKGASTPFGVTPRIKSFPVVAVFEIGMSEFDATFIYMPMGEAQSFFNREGDATLIEIFLDDADRVDEARSAIEQAAERPVLLSDWRQRNRTFFSALEVERNVMFLILTLIVLVASLNIIAGLVMLVKDKSSDIAILRTMGATRYAVMRIFVVTGASIGIVGTLAGVGLGLVVSLNIESIRQLLSRLTGANLFPAELYFLSRLPAVVDPTEVVTVVLLAMGLSLLATMYPSWRAARLDPVEALRYG
ncbi:MAG: lipoprotein-releasing transporter permease subunit [Enterovirga sp.]|nr:lipoprotein-releasing transporter permease subunit [Enterovirga sp.]